MKRYLDNKKQEVSYLLGEMSEAERDRFEECFFTDEDLSLSLDEAENDLIDEYLRGDLDAAQKQKFENNYLISERRREKLYAAEILQKDVFAEKSILVAAEPISFWQKLTEKFAFPRLVLAGGLATVALFILFGGLLFIRQNKNGEIVTISNENQNVSIELVNQLSVNQNLPNSNLQSNTEQKPANKSNKTGTNLTLPQNNNRKPANIEENKKSEPPPAPSQIPQKKQIFAFTFMPALRSSEKPILMVPQNAEIIRLRVVHNNLQKFIRYRAEIRAPDGDLIWSREISVNSNNLSKPLTLDVRSGALKSGSYELTLSGATSDGQLEEINFYNFVVRKGEKE